MRTLIYSWLIRWQPGASDWYLTLGVTLWEWTLNLWALMLTPRGKHQNWTGWEDTPLVSQTFAWCGGKAHTSVSEVWVWSRHESIGEHMGGAFFSHRHTSGNLGCTPWCCAAASCVVGTVPPPFSHLRAIRRPAYSRSSIPKRLAVQWDWARVETVPLSHPYTYWGAKIKV